ncbi:hypothetical protein Rhopal_004300-T1 [Rhodotorula paludigena]|uniref:Inositolphosphotransferase Aur1/Ipt1 domain-containing protein n=1 Tax=Rhodotorula paludigena TaxID=86838 RepID=A0AAV5GFP2_9BASI|nr:hypothetical protein Rhopal_004300-T1 [Rhodotorula paludigena]
MAVLRQLRVGQLVSALGALLLHCRWVLLNGASVPYRLWTVLAGAFPTVLWTVLFKQAKHIPDDIRPPIHIDLLPTLNRLLLSPLGVILVTLSLIPLARYVYFEGAGDKEGEERGRGRAYAISILLFPTALWATAWCGQADVSNFLDLLAFGSYGALHFASPIIAGWWIWGFGSQGAASTFGWTLGAQNLAGLATHLVFPNAAPWFYDVYGIDAAQPDYTYNGNPAGLIRVDTILGTHIYAKAFGHGPVVFGAIPSLHAATAICCCLYVVRYSKGYRGLAFMWVYCFWMLWSTQYFHHHFAIDLIAGTFYSLVSFTFFSRVYLRKLDRAHYANGLTNGYDRLFFARRDGEHYSDYGDKMLRRWSDDDEDACGAGGAGRGANGAGAVRLSRSSSGGSGAARSAGGYAPVPDAHFGSDGDDVDDDDRPPHGLHPGVAGAYLSLEELGPGAGEKDAAGGGRSGSAGGSSTRGSSIEEKRRAKGFGAPLNGGGAGA